MLPPSLWSKGKISKKSEDRNLQKEILWTLSLLRHIWLHPVHEEIDFEVYQKLYPQYTPKEIDFSVFKTGMLEQ
jgi:hypothetical protein